VLEGLPDQGLVRLGVREELELERGLADEPLPAGDGQAPALEGGPEGGEKGVEGEKGAGEVVPPSPRLRRTGRCSGCRCFGGENLWSWPGDGGIR
jgi:hypothetical protein